MMVLKKKNRILKTALMTIIMVLCFFGCTYGFPEGYDKDECVAECEDIISVVNTLDFEKLHSMLREDLRDNITPQDFSDAWEQKLEKLGEFVKFGNPVLSGEMDNETGEEFAMIAYYCYYENGKAVFTIYFDSNMELTSISMKLD